MTNIRRRELLRGLFLVTVVASAPGALTACTTDEEEVPLSSDPAEQARVYPQGVASGDPKPESVVLWTRVSLPGAVRYEVATDEAFTSIVAQGEVAVDASSDNSLRLKVEGLSAFTSYHYRFISDHVISVVGRTKTAPSPDQDTPVRFAFASCQDFNGRYYHAYKLLVDEPEVDFVLFLGDYVYETEGDPRFQDPTAERKITLDDGLTIGEKDAEFNAAFTLADYRSLYKQYRSDPDIQRAHQLFPFVTIWDDHEFADDCWQDHSTHFNEKDGNLEQYTERREAATRAWFEFQPADVTHDGDVGFPNDITIYRKLRFGKHVELVLTDQRYYRDDHLIPEGPGDLSVGKTSAFTSLGSRQLLLKSGFDPKEAAAKPTMLGAKQKSWLIDALTKSDATWKLWGSETQLSQMVIDLSSFDLPDMFKDVFYFTVDQWDGYRSERAEILQAIASVANVAIFTGDIHAFYGCEIHTDFDNPGAPTAVEYVCAGISSSSVQEITQRVVDGSKTLTDLGLGDLVPQFDTLLLDASPHYKYANSKTNGVAFADVSADELKVTFLEIDNVTKESFDGTVKRITLVTKAGESTVSMA